MEGLIGSSSAVEPRHSELLQAEEVFKLPVDQIHIAQHMIVINVDFQKFGDVAQFSHSNRNIDIYPNNCISKVHLQSIVLFIYLLV